MLDTWYDWHLGSSLTLPSVNMMFPVVCECIENISSTKRLLISDHILMQKYMKELNYHAINRDPGQAI